MEIIWLLFAMKLLFLTLLSFNSLRERNIYTDLLRVFVDNGHEVYVISPIEKRYNQKTHLLREEGACILRLQIGNTQKTNLVEKGISTLMIEPTFKKTISKYFSDIRFDLVLYSTPPITLVSAIEYVKKRDNAKTYLLLKDIFPQNAVDLGMINKAGVKGLVYRYFRNRERKLYAISDKIGCMSQANVDYVLSHNPEVEKYKVEICPNSIEVVDKIIDEDTKKSIRIKYGIPIDRKVLVYGGNLGKPQGISFLIECLKTSADIDNVFFLIVGDGTEYSLLEKFVNKDHQENIKLMRRLPQEDYDTLVEACDVGLIFLDHRFTIPNFPSRMLSYMQARLPVFAVTDPNTDLGQVIVSGGFGWWCESNDSSEFNRIVHHIVSVNSIEMGNRAFEYLKNNYSANNTYNLILD